MRLHRDESGLAGAMLVVVIAWALAAVLMLTATLVSAKQIDDRVVVITRNVEPIDQDLENVRLLTETNRIADGILEAARPLPGQLDELISINPSIDRNVLQILDSAQQINQTAKAINGTAGAINSTVNSIHATATDINGTVDSILGNVRAIHATTITCPDPGQPGRAPQTGDIIANLERSIRACGTKGIPGINRRVDIVLAAVQGIKGDTANVLAQVGPGHEFPGGGASIHGHANSIDCSPAVRPASTRCGQ